jgi:hypothetical protein
MDMDYRPQANGLPVAVMQVASDKYRRDNSLVRSMKNGNW